jgi:hypothetical protein
VLTFTPIASRAACEMVCGQSEISVIFDMMREFEIMVNTNDYLKALGVVPMARNQAEGSHHCKSRRPQSPKARTLMFRIDSCSLPAQVFDSLKLYTGWATQCAEVDAWSLLPAHSDVKRMESAGARAETARTVDASAIESLDSQRQRLLQVSSIFAISSQMPSNT